MSWFLIEALGPLDTPMTILAKDGERRDWVSLRSLQRNEGVDVTDLAEWVRRSGSVFDQVVSGRSGHIRHVARSVALKSISQSRVCCTTEVTTGCLGVTAVSATDRW
ncbi:GAF domain-containing protein [Nocardia sp. NPDC101769]|uniref:GAF domain-containing protein n=1 Tax=Nocardia sp. NPDC101769 TaxID=3364333 RepID=UPI003802F4D2